MFFSLQWGGTSPGNLRFVSCDADINVSSTRISKEALYKHLAGEALVKNTN
jgi:hypothetical protein